MPFLQDPTARKILQEIPAFKAKTGLSGAVSIVNSEILAKVYILSTSHYLLLTRS